MEQFEKYPYFEVCSIIEAYKTSPFYYLAIRCKVNGYELL